MMEAAVVTLHALSLLTLLYASAPDDEALVPPPPPLLEDAPCREQPCEEERFPSGGDAPTPSVPPASPDARGAGLPPWLTASVQLGAGVCTSSLLAVPLAYLNMLSFGLCGCLVYPSLASWALVWLGDSVGDSRGSPTEPWIAAVSVGAAASAAMWVGVIGVGVMDAFAPLGAGNLSFASMAFLGLFGGAALCGPAASAAAAVAAYHAFSRPRASGEAASEPPPLLPLLSRRGTERASAPGVPRVMAY